MKKALLTLIVLSVSVSLFAQGTVLFSNVGANKNVKWDANNDGVGDRDLATTDGVQVSLWFAPAGTTDPAAASWAMLGNPAPLIAAGLFSGGKRTVPDATAGTVYSFQVRAWETAVYGTAPTAWAQASGTVGAKVTTFSPNLQTATGGFGTPPGPDVNLAPLFGAQPNIMVGTVVPEPSVLALGVLGVGALLMLRRRK
jgi:MYXO-CTERM domain-containing protein